MEILAIIISIAALTTSLLSIKRPVQSQVIYVTQTPEPVVEEKVEEPALPAAAPISHNESHLAWRNVKGETEAFRRTPNAPINKPLSTPGPLERPYGFG